MKTEILIPTLTGNESNARSEEGTHKAGLPAKKVPLWLRVLLGVILGVAFGIAFGIDPILGGLGNQDFGECGMFFIEVLKILAVPLVFFGIVDALLNTSISGRQAGKLLVICFLNVSVAVVIGLTLINGLRPGVALQGELGALLNGLSTQESSKNLNAGNGTAGMFRANPVRVLRDHLPKMPGILSVVIAGLGTGVALRVARRVKFLPRTVPAATSVLHSAYEGMLKLVGWVIVAVPFAVFGVVAHVVSRTGVAPFAALWSFVAIVLLGLAIHSLAYYPTVIRLRTGMERRHFLAKGADAILTGFSTNSSLAAVPVTLRCLTEKMGVSQESARLSACIGTNLNNDGIALYEAMAALFLAQACGLELTLGQQLIVMVASVVAAMGVAGVPEAGLLALPLVLGAAGLGDGVVLAALPLLLAVDWLIARARSGVNVMSDMTVALLLDGRSVDENA